MREGNKKGKHHILNLLLGLFQELYSTAKVQIITLPNREWRGCSRRQRKRKRGAKMTNWFFFCAM